MKAIVTTGDGHFELQDVTVPKISRHEVLIKVVAIAQNPSDWKTAHLHKQPNNILGCECAGIIVAIGLDVPSGLRYIGERVIGIVHGGVGPNGAFAEYVAVMASLAISLPHHMTFEEGAQLPVACFTACQSLYQCLNLPSPFERSQEPITVLIWSGTSATGQYAIQLAKLGGLRVVTTASPKHFDLMRRLGADEVYDYVDSKTSRNIFDSTGGTIQHAMDCASEGRTPNQVSTSLSKTGGTIATLLPYTSRTKNVQTQFILAYSIFGKAVDFPFPFPANEAHHQNAIKYAKLISSVLASQKLTPVPIKLFPHGLLSVKDGFEYMKAGKVHAEKITYRIADTPGLSSSAEVSIFQ